MTQRSLIVAKLVPGSEKRIAEICGRCFVTCPVASRGRRLKQPHRR